jgi:hypothetical protein
LDAVARSLPERTSPDGLHCDIDGVVEATFPHDVVTWAITLSELVLQLDQGLCE